MLNLKCPKLSKLSSRTLALTLATALLLSTLWGCLVNLIKVDAAAVSATDSHSVFTDEFTGSVLNSDWGWSAATERPQYTAAVSDGKLNLTVDGGTAFTSLRYPNPTKYSALNQRVAVEFNSTAKNRVRVWARVGKTDTGNFRSVDGYNAVIDNSGGTGAIVSVYKRTWNGSTSTGTDTKLGSCGDTSFNAGQKLKLEMVVTGASPTVITVNLYKYSDSLSAYAMVGTGTFVDNEADLQDKGTAGVSATHDVGGTVAIERFEYTSTDNVTGKYYIDDQNVSRQTFGQVVALDPAKTYVLAADTVDNGTDSTGEKLDALWVEHDSTGVENNNNRLIATRSQLKNNRTKVAVAGTGVEYNETFTVFAEFNFQNTVNLKKFPNSKNGSVETVRTIVGLRLDQDTYTVGKFSNFRLYAKDDPNKTNLLVNGDFKMGFYGWSNTVQHNGAALLAEGSSTVSNGNVILKSTNADGYETLFENVSYNPELSAPTAGESHSVLTDEFTGTELGSDWRWVAEGQDRDKYTATVYDGKLNLFVDGGTAFTSLRYANAKKYEYINQRVSAEFASVAKNRVRVWARVGKTGTGNFRDVDGYSAVIDNSGGTGAVVSVWKRANRVDTKLGSCGDASFNAGQKLKLEMVVTGASPTVITVNLYKYSDSLGDYAMVGTNTFVDSEADLQDKGTAGIAATHDAAAGDTVAVDRFEYTTTDNVIGNYYIKSNETERVTIGQVVALDPTKTYVFSAYAKDNGTHSTGGYELLDPLWVEYQDTDSTGGNSRLVTSNTALKTNRSETSVGDSGVPYSKYYTVFTEFNFEGKSNLNYFPNTYDGANSSTGTKKVRTIVGIRCDVNTPTLGTYTNFRLYAKDDPNKTNLLVNGNFKMGLYGWKDSIADQYNGVVLEKESVITAQKGYLTFHSAEDKEYDEIFKNNDYKVDISPDEGQLVVQNKGTKEYKRFGRIMNLSPDETYVYSASYKYIDQKGSYPYVEYWSSETNNWKACPTTSTDDIYYYRTTQEFAVPSDALLSGGKAKLRIGFTTGEKNADAYFGNFDLHTKSAPTVNLFDDHKNADFKYGMYGWYWLDTELKISGQTKTDDGAIELVVKDDDFFKRPAWQELTGKIALHTTGKGEYCRVGQIVSLEPGKTYVYSLSHKFVDQKGSQPLVSYYKDNEYVRILNLKTTSDKTYYRDLYEFTVPKDGTVINGKVKMQICISTGEKNSDAYWGDFNLYEKSKPNTNLFTNPDFKWGFYGWTSNGKNHIAYTEYGLKTLLQGEAELVKVSNDFFKRPAWSELTGFWAAHTTGKGEYARFGQILNLDPKKTYVYSVYYKDINSLGSMPLVEYRVYDKENDSYSYVIDESAEKVEDQTYYKVTFTFKVPKDAYLVDGKASVRIGITTGQKNADCYFGEFLLYDKADGKKTNLLDNASFRLGLYGWTSNGYNGLPITDYGLKTTKMKDVELKKVTKDFFKRPAWEKFDEEPMLHITGKANYAHPGQYVYLEPGETYFYSMYEKYFSQNYCQPLAFVSKNGKSEPVAKSLEVESEDLEKCFKVYKFTVPKDVDVDAEGKAKVLVGITTGITGADAYFYDLNLYKASDPKKTQIFTNGDFELGLFGWTGSYYNGRGETEYGARIFKYAEEAELVPYNADIFVNDSSDEYFNDGDWAAIFGADESYSEWLESMGGGETQAGAIDENTTALKKIINMITTTDYFRVYIVIGGVVILGGISVFIVFFIKRKKRKGQEEI